MTHWTIETGFEIEAWYITPDGGVGGGDGGGGGGGGGGRSGGPPKPDMGDGELHVASMPEGATPELLLRAFERARHRNTHVRERPVMGHDLIDDLLWHLNKADVRKPEEAKAALNNQGYQSVQVCAETKGWKNSVCLSMEEVCTFPWKTGMV